MKKHVLVGTWITTVAIFLYLILLYFRFASLHPSTDDAYVQANTIQIAAEINGPVKRVFVQDNQPVYKGQLLFTIDPRPFQYALEKAEANLALTKQQIHTEKAAIDAAKANLAQAKANLEVANKNVPRTLTLVREKQISQAEGVTEQGQLDSAKAAVNVAQSQLQEAVQTLGKSGSNNANLQTAKASVAQAKLNLSYTKIYAPGDGYLVNFLLQPGTMIIAKQSLFALVETKQWWIDANYKETDLSRIKAGQTAKIILDIYPDHVYRGYVQSISAGSGAAFSLLPPENASGNWVKVTQRFPVKVIIANPNPAFPLRVGASAVVTINTVS